MKENNFQPLAFAMVACSSMWGFVEIVRIGGYVAALAIVPFLGFCAGIAGISKKL